MDIDEPKGVSPDASFLLTLAKAWALAMVVYVGTSALGYSARSEVLLELGAAVLIFGVAGIPIVGAAYLALTPLRRYVDRREGPAA